MLDALNCFLITPLSQLIVDYLTCGTCTYIMTDNTLCSNANCATNKPFIGETGPPGCCDGCVGPTGQAGEEGYNKKNSKPSQKWERKMQNSKMKHERNGFRCKLKN